MRTCKVVTRILSLGIAACLLSGCAEMPRPLLPGGAAVERPGQGLIFGRVAMIRDDDDRMTSLPSFARSFGWELLQADTGKKFVVDPLTENGLFALPLPAGIYHVTKLRYEDRYGLWEGTLAASFSVKSGSSTYLGTWEITFAGLGPAIPITARTLNDFKSEQEVFKDRYAINESAVTVALLQPAPKGNLALLRPRSEQ